MTLRHVGAFVFTGFICASSLADRYELKEGSFFQQGCFPPCACPFLFQGAVSGGFDMTLTTDVFGFTQYAITDVEWWADTFVPIPITGSGTYTLLGNFVQTQQLKLDLIVGTEPLTLDSGVVIPDQLPPNITAQISVNGGFCFDTVIDVVAARIDLLADIDGDGCVGQTDLSLLLACFGETSCGGADLNGDTLTDAADLNILLSEYELGC